MGQRRSSHMVPIEIYGLLQWSRGEMCEICHGGVRLTLAVAL